MSRRLCDVLHFSCACTKESIREISKAKGWVAEKNAGGDTATEIMEESDKESEKESEKDSDKESEKESDKESEKESDKAEKEESSDADEAKKKDVQKGRCHTVSAVVKMMGILQGMIFDGIGFAGAAYWVYRNDYFHDISWLFILACLFVLRLLRLAQVWARHPLLAGEEQSGPKEDPNAEKKKEAHTHTLKVVLPRAFEQRKLSALFRWCW